MRTWRCYSVACAAALIALPACAVRTTTLATDAMAAPLFADATADVARMGRETNEARFDVLTAMLAARRIAFEVEPFTIDPRKGEPRTQGRNIVVTIAGRSPEVVVGAHYDAARIADGTLSKGAVDNGASSVILVRVAEALLKARLRTQVRVVFFDMEELGLLGSAQFVQAHRDRPTRAMVNLDVNGFGDNLIFGPQTASNGAAVQALRTICLDVAAACTELPRMPPSDDISFQNGGIPAVSIATVPALQAHQLWLLMNGGKASGLQPGFTPQILGTIHTAADTPDLVERNAMVRAYRIALALVRALGKQ
jgi:Zn-dependent M28 family amino/carboxypeptidase